MHQQKKIYAPTQIYASKHTYAYTHFTYFNIHTCMHIYTYTYIHIHTILHLLTHTYLYTDTQKLVFCTTGSLGEQGENELRDVATKLGATVVRKWGNSVTHLVTGRSISGATTKLLCAIATGVPVVRLDWCTRMADAITSQGPTTSSAPLPEESDFR